MKGDQTMKKLLALLLATVMVLSVAALPALAEEPAAEQTLYLYQDEGNESVQFPWYNLRLPQILMYRSLVTSNAAETEWYPDMAEYTVSEDGLTYTFVLQDGLKWSDGEPITADDIVWNIETALKAAQVASAYTTCFGYIQGAAEYADGSAESISGIAVDGNTITISLTAPYAFFLKNLANFSFLPKHCLEDVDPLELYQCDFWKAPVTSGYYKFGEMVVGSYYTLVANENLSLIHI